MRVYIHTLSQRWAFESFGMFANQVAIALHLETRLHAIFGSMRKTFASLGNLISENFNRLRREILLNLSQIFVVEWKWSVNFKNVFLKLRDFRMMTRLQQLWIKISFRRIHFFNKIRSLFPLILRLLLRVFGKGELPFNFGI